MSTGRRTTGLTGIVLAGGRSSRLGTPKPLISLGGKLVLARVADTLRPLCEELILVVRPDQDDDSPDTGIALRMHVVTDTPPYQGPLAAIHAGFEATVTPLAFVTGADHPFLSRPLIRAMVALARSAGSEPETVVPRTGGRLHPLHAVYAVDSWTPRMRHALERGETSPGRLLTRAFKAGEPPMTVMTEDEVEQLDPRMLSLLDIDTPASLGLARQIVSGRRTVTRPDIRRGGL